MFCAMLPRSERYGAGFFFEKIIDKEEFASSLDEPFTIDVDEGNVERTYNLRIPVFGEDAPVRIIINYDKENETMIFKSNDYVLSDREAADD